NRNVRILAECDCGRTTVANGADLFSGKTKSCGCLRESCRLRNLEKRAQQSKGVGELRRPLESNLAYRSWVAMKQRCRDPNATGYHNYGGRGITICERWLESFDNFYKDMGDRPSR